MSISKATAPILMTDGYKIQHFAQYPVGTEYVCSNWTARGSRIPEVNEITFIGLQYAIQKRLMEDFEIFFAADVDEVCAEYARVMEGYMGPVPTDHIRALHNLGYIPLEFKALPEGTPVPLRVPMFTVENTHPDFFWVTNYFETVLSAELWMPMTSATNAARIRRLLNDFAEKTGEPIDGVGFQGHDFSMRGMAGAEAANLSGLGHLVVFTGTETVPVLGFIDKYYPFDGFLAGTVPATEHSVMCAGGEENEADTFLRLMDIYPTGILSVVSDSWDYWAVLTDLLPAMKDVIMARDGKLVVRPDSGDPADIICGTRSWETTYVGENDYHENEWVVRPFGEGKTPEEKGSIEILWDTFGGTVNDAGYKVLDSHIGLIYGDSMNYDRVRDICERLEAKGFSSTNVVFGLGSFGYQFQTRDTFGFAMKATNVVIDGVEKAIFKNPKTDNGVKRSLKGRIQVIRDVDGALVAVDDDNRQDGDDLLTTVWKDGKFVKYLGLDEVRANSIKEA